MGCGTSTPVHDPPVSQPRGVPPSRPKPVAPPPSSTADITKPVPAQEYPTPPAAIHPSHDKASNSDTYSSHKSSDSTQTRSALEGEDSAKLLIVQCDTAPSNQGADTLAENAPLAPTVSAEGAPLVSVNSVEFQDTLEELQAHAAWNAAEFQQLLAQDPNLINTGGLDKYLHLIDMLANGGDSEVFTTFEDQNTLMEELSKANGSSSVGNKKKYVLPADWDWTIKEESITICQLPNGDPWMLGKGGFGEVYRGLLDDVQEVAVKVLEEITSEDQFESLQREALLLRGLRHPNVVHFLGASMRGKSMMIVSELMTDGDLLQRLRHPVEGPDWRWYGNGLKVALDVACAIHFLHHNKNIIHFDIKSNNVLLSPGPVAKLADVGFAVYKEKTYLTNPDRVGTFCWVAPEVLMGSKVTSKVDIFSYGVVLWELVTGETPRTRNYRPRRVPEECPAEVDQLIERCMSNDHELRPGTKEIIQLLRSY